MILPDVKPAKTRVKLDCKDNKESKTVLSTKLWKVVVVLAGKIYIHMITKSTPYDTPEQQKLSDNLKQKQQTF